MSIPKTRRWLYLLTKLLGDVQAVQQAGKKKSATPLAKRAGRRIIGKALGRGMGRLFQ